MQVCFTRDEADVSLQSKSNLSTESDGKTFSKTQEGNTQNHRVYIRQLRGPQTCSSH